MGKFDQRAEEFGLLVGLHDSARRVEDLPLDWIIADPENPRRVFDETELKDLAASIAARGVLQPIIVAPCRMGRAPSALRQAGRFVLVLACDRCSARRSLWSPSLLMRFV
ncbi:ParB N-terminal domain-containing protein (plasmid) [Sphingobium sp. SJ10-10]|uniref:ParB N-terminal domain-containing protein n=1 Tax=Sphingobium sp. SJ10-10 TaxID=3114999 RepID=UPI00331B475F